MLNKLGLIYRTAKHLRPVQIRYRLYYIIRNRLRRITGHQYKFSIPRKGRPLNLGKVCPSAVSWQQSSNTFTFLNKKHTFEGKIDWNIDQYGKLWAYTLNYFDYLHQPGMTKEKGLQLICDFISQVNDNQEGLEPYPISLRGINWIKFLSNHQIKDRNIDSSLYAQYQLLLKNLEYHILGNHLLENGCSLLFGAFYFQDEKFWEKAKEILASELNEQILDDGGHYERSVMYHCIILERFMDCYNVLNNNHRFNNQEQLAYTLAKKISIMNGWLAKMQWANGDAPEVNDHVYEMVPPIHELYSYNERLDLKTRKLSLGASGYRKYQTGNYECLADVGNIGPDYVPGHAHSDIFSFLLRISGDEIITDTGTSTYGNNERRNTERSTVAHNTVLVEGQEQNEIWSAFRVGRRGHVEILVDKEDKLTARHDGYKFMNVKHERSFEFGENSISIADYLIHADNDVKGTFYLHFHPGVTIRLVDGEIQGESFHIFFSGANGVRSETYQKAIGYDRLKDATKLVIDFENNLKTEIKIKI